MHQLHLVVGSPLKTLLMEQPMMMVLTMTTMMTMMTVMMMA
jgi:hypothetical protein